MQSRPANTPRLTEGRSAAQMLIGIIAVGANFNIGRWAVSPKRDSIVVEIDDAPHTWLWGTTLSRALEHPEVVVEEMKGYVRRCRVCQDNAADDTQLQRWAVLFDRTACAPCGERLH